MNPRAEAARFAAAPSPVADFIVSREFAAPRDLVWRAHTECRHLMHWWSPKGFTMQHCKVDLRPGGIFHYGLRSPDGDFIWGRIVYREIVAPERLAYVVSFSNEFGDIARHPASPNWPLEILSTATFDQHGGRTRVTVRWSPDDATTEEQAAFDAGRDLLRQGFTGTYDQLAAYLAAL